MAAAIANIPSSTDPEFVGSVLDFVPPLSTNLSLEVTRKGLNDCGLHGEETDGCQYLRYVR